MTAPRREQLLSAAADLFAARGYHAVGMDDIGGAAGISGPGVYRHFASKQALLEDLCDRAMTRMLAGATDIPAHEPAPGAALAALVDLHVEFAVGERLLLGVWAREQRALSEPVRRSLRQRERAYEQVWRDALLRARDDLSEPEAQVVVSCSLALLNSTALVEVRLADDRLAALLRAMALASLSAGAGPMSTSPEARGGPAEVPAGSRP